MSGMSRTSGIAGMSGMWRMLGEKDRTKCHTFLEQQARADLNDDGNVRNFRNVRNVEISGMLRMSGHRQTPSVIHFWNHKLELI